MAGSREYRIWIHMKTRCLNSFDKAFPDYGGRGIEVCDKWLAFQGFFEDMGRCPSKLHTLERVDNDGNYCRENCVWATMAEQSRNKRSSRKTLFRGEVSCGRDIAIVLSVHNRFVYQCLDLGMNGDDIEELVNRFRSLS